MTYGTIAIQINKKFQILIGSEAYAISHDAKNTGLNLII
jgi:hypothetical protein